MKKFLIYIFRFIYSYMRYFILLFVIISLYIIFYHLDDLIYLFHQINSASVYAETKEDHYHENTFNNYQIDLLKYLYFFKLKDISIFKYYKNIRFYHIKNNKIKKDKAINDNNEAFNSMFLSLGIFKFYLRIYYKIYNHSNNDFYNYYKNHYFYNKILKDFREKLPRMCYNRYNPITKLFNDLLKELRNSKKKSK